MKKYVLLLALLLIAALSAIGLHPEVLDGFKKELYADEVKTSTSFFNEKVKTPLLAALKGGPDEGMQSGGLTAEELAAQENGDPDDPEKPDTKNTADTADTPDTPDTVDPADTVDTPDTPGTISTISTPGKTGTDGGISGITKGGGDEPAPNDPDGGGESTNPEDDPKVVGTDPKDPEHGNSEPEPGTTDKPDGSDKAADPDKSATSTTSATPATPATPTTPEKGDGDNPESTVAAGTDTPAKASSGDAIKYVYDEFEAAGGVEFTGYSGVKSQTCWFNDVTGSLDMPNGNPEGGRLNVVIGTEELDCKDAKFTRVCLGYYLEIDDYPTATFTSKSIKPMKGDNMYRVLGELQVKDKTKIVGFNALITQDEEAETSTVSAEFKLKRDDFGMDYNGVAGYAISDEFSLKLELTGETE